MNNLLKLIKGELLKLYKYKIITIGIIVSILWIIIISLPERSSIERFIPNLIYMDAGLMSIILLGASFFLEKQEGSIKSLLVAPVNFIDILLSKILGAIFLTLISAFLVVSTSVIIHQISINYFLLFIYIILIVISHVAIGFVIILFSKDFGSMIGLYAVFMFLSFLPSILLTINVISKEYEYILLISPSHAGQLLLNSTFWHEDIMKVIVSIIYLLCISVILYSTIVYKRFKRYAIEG